jgi:hypothetical protein
MTQRTTEFDVNAGRNAFRRSSGRDLVRDLENMDPEELRRQQFAMRSFTESIETDLPPLPQLPPSLDIDQYGFEGGGMRESSTGDTIVEVARLTKLEEEIGANGLGETQKYVMAVPGPGHVEQEIEMHKSLLRDTQLEESDLDAEMQMINGGDGQRHSGNGDYAEQNMSQDPEWNALRKEYKVAMTQRPRPTTPTSHCMIESYVEEQTREDAMQKSAEEKIKVTIPGQEKVKCM